MKQINAVFMVFIGLLGVFLTYSSLGIQNKLNNKTCTSSKLKDSTRAVGIIGLTGIITCISYFVCIMRCGCDKVTTSTSQNTELAIYGYLSFVVVISITIITLGSIIENEAKGECKDASKYSGIIWGIGVTLLVFSTGYLGFKGYNKYIVNKNLSRFNDTHFSF